MLSRDYDNVLELFWSDLLIVKNIIQVPQSFPNLSGLKSVATFARLEGL